MKELLIIGAVILAAIVFMCVMIVREARRNGGFFRLSFYGHAVLHRKDCEHCSGGAQALVNGRWGKIPDHMRMDKQRDEHGPYFGPPTANIRNCPKCQGLGFTLSAADKITLPPSQQR